MAFRVLRKSPGFAFAAVVTLALAIGANAVVFGIMDGLTLRPLNVPQPESLYGTEYGDYSGFQSYPNYADLRDRNHSFEDLAAFNFVFVGLDTGNDPSLATGYATSGNYFDVLKIQPYLGRFFHSSDEHGRNRAAYVVLAYGYWHSRGTVALESCFARNDFSLPVPRGRRGLPNPNFDWALVDAGGLPAVAGVAAVCRSQAGDIRSALQQTEIEPLRLQLEMTESVAAADPKLTTSVLSHLKHLGIGVILDDFGTGTTRFAACGSFPWTR